MLTATAAVFALFTGMNDGGAILAYVLRDGRWRPITAALVLSIMVAAVPILLGAEVATTLTERLVSFGRDSRGLVLLSSLGASLLVVGVLTRRGLPTSITLALVGGIVGAGLGRGLPVSWTWVAIVLGLGAAAPVVGGALGAGAIVVWRRSTHGLKVDRQLRVAARLGFFLQSLAYSANDGQKMLAVFVIAGLGTVPSLLHDVRVAVAIGALFAVGALAGTRRHGETLTRGVLLAAPLNAATAQLASAVAVFGSSLAGAPVSMTQAVAGGLIGSALPNEAARVRWRAVARLGTAWVATLPLSAGVAFLLGRSLPWAGTTP